MEWIKKISMEPVTRKNFGTSKLYSFLRYFFSRPEGRMLLPAMVAILAGGMLLLSVKSVNAQNSLPQPENFIGTVAKCSKCQARAAAVTAVLKERFSVADRARSMASLLPSRRRSLAKLEAERAVLVKQAQDLTEQSIGERNRARKQALVERSNVLVNRQNEIDIEIATLEEEISKFEARLKKLIERHSGLNRQLLKLGTQLADCEKSCSKTVKDVGNADLAAPLFDPNLPQPENFIGTVAKCSKCQARAAAVTAVLKERFSVADRARSMASLLPSRRRSLAKLEAERAVLVKQAQDLTEQSIGERNRARKQALVERSNVLVNRQNEIDIEIATLEEEISKFEARLKKLIERHSGLNRELAKLRTNLSACDETCDKAGKDAGNNDLAAPLRIERSADGAVLDKKPIIQTENDGMLVNRPLKLIDLEGCGSFFTARNFKMEQGFEPSPCPRLTGGRVATQEDYSKGCDQGWWENCGPPAAGASRTPKIFGVHGMPLSTFCLGLHFNSLSDSNPAAGIIAARKAGLFPIFKYESSIGKLSCFYFSKAQFKLLREQFEKSK